MYRVFLTGAISRPENSTGHRGHSLVLTLLLSFTGLFVALGPVGDLGDHGRFEHGARHPGVGVEGWSIALESQRRQPDHSARMREFALLGTERGRDDFERFYVCTGVAIPLAAALLIMIHFWRVRKTVDQRAVVSRPRWRELQWSSRARWHRRGGLPLVGRTASSSRILA